MKMLGYIYRIPPGETSLFLRLVRSPMEASGTVYFVAEEGKEYGFSVAEDPESLTVHVVDADGNRAGESTTFDKEPIRSSGGGFPIVIPVR